MKLEKHDISAPVLAPSYRALTQTPEVARACSLQSEVQGPQCLTMPVCSSAVLLQPEPTGAMAASDSSSSSSEDEAAVEPPPARPEWLTEEDDNARSMVYLVTFAAVLEATALQAETPLKSLEGLERADIRDAVLDAVQHPAEDTNRRGRGRPRTQALEAVKLVVFLEEPRHFHVALKLTCLSRFLPLKAALRRRSGLASHWSTSHTQWWSVVRYGVFTTDHKQAVDLTPLVWLKAAGALEGVQVGHGPCHEYVVPGSSNIVLNLYEEAQEPFNASAWVKRRQKAEVLASAPGPGNKKKAKVEKFTPLDFTAMVLEKNLLTPNAVLAYVQDHGSHACQLYCMRNQKRLPDLIEGALQWRDAKKLHAVEQETDWDLLQRLAGTSCACSGPCLWWMAMSDFFRRNQATVDGELLAAALAQVICHGPSKTRRVPLIAGVTNAGKSLVLDPLVNVFGRKAVDFCPAQGASMALSSLATSKGVRFIYWDEFSPTEFASRPPRSPTVSAVTFKKLFAGQVLRVQVSQAHHDGNPDFRWTRGAALTAPLDGLWEVTQPVTREDVKHMQSRVIQFDAHVAVAGPLQPIPHCAASWCRFIVQGSAAYASRLSRGVAAEPAPGLPIEDDDL